jgi:hypothetical protein
MIAEYADYSELKQVPKSKKQDIRKRAIKLIEMGLKNKTLRVLKRKGIPVAITARTLATMPRVKNQQSLFLMYDKKQIQTIRPWGRKHLREIALAAPRFSVIGLGLKDDALFGDCLTKADFSTRYEILEGDTRIALNQLMKVKKPLANLDHLGLEIKELTTKKQIADAMILQKYVATRFRRHGYFSHTPAQLESDKKEYEEIISQKNGLILGVFKEKKMLGLMTAIIVGDHSSKKMAGGFSFFLHPSIQGLGITKTGYRKMLEFLLKNKIKNFFGGTSQPAIQSMGRVMKRKVKTVLYVKM